MANSWGTNPMILDTAATDTSYNPANDVRNGGAQYSSFPYKIRRIEPIGGVNTNAILVKECGPADVKDGVIWQATLETGDLGKCLDLGDGQVFQGIYVETLGGSTKLAVYLA